MIEAGANPKDVQTRCGTHTSQPRLENSVSINKDAGCDGVTVARVRGECPRAGFAQFIPSDVVAACRKYLAEGYQLMPKILSVDVARYGDDRSLIGLRQGRKFEIKAKLAKLDTVELLRESASSSIRKSPTR